MKRNISFDLFLAVWNMHQNLSTPPIHLNMGRFLSRGLRRRQRRLLLMAFRGAGKSTLTGLFCAWVLLHDPATRILILSADEELAEQMLRHARHILETHPLTKTLHPVKKTLWASDRLQVKRNTVSRDPSIRAAGITSNITGARADMILCDDVEVPKTCDTALKREQLRNKLSELDFILTPDGTILYIGTPHTEESLYASDGFLKHYERLEIPLDENAWPERFSVATIAKLKESVGARVFGSQMLLQRIAVSEARLDPALLIPYSELPDDAVLSKCVWDPAFGSVAGDKSVLALVYQDSQRRLYIHDIRYLPITKGDEAALEQCRDVIAFLRRHELHHLVIESNGLGQFLPGLLRRELGHVHYTCSLQPLYQSRAKNTRILEAFEARLASRMIFLHHSLQTSPFWQEMRDWNPSRNDNRDDGMDAVATAIHLLPQISSSLSKPLYHLHEADDE